MLKPKLFFFFLLENMPILVQLQAREVTLASRQPRGEGHEGEVGGIPPGHALPRGWGDSPRAE